MEQQLKFITIEGVDGAGKSSIIAQMKKFLEDRGEEVVLTREPGGTQLGEELRELLLKKTMSVATETLLMFAARQDNKDLIIAPALSSGKWVICDRHSDSTYAYQVVAKGFSEHKYNQLKQVVHGDMIPGMTLILDVPLHVSKARLAKTGKNPDKFESAGDSFHTDVINGYKNKAKQEPNRCKLIDASGTPEQTQEQAIFHLNEFYKKFENKKKLKP